MMPACPKMEDYVGGLPPEQGAALERVRAVVEEVAPEAEQGVGYGVPPISMPGARCAGLRAAKSHLSVFPFSPAAIEAVRDRLEGFDVSKGTIRFSPRAPVPDVLADLVRARMEEIDDYRSPASRGHRFRMRLQGCPRGRRGQRDRDAVRDVEQAGGVEAAVAPPKRAADPFTTELRPSRCAAAARPPPDQRGAELRQPADGADRRHDSRRAVRQPEHDVPTVAPARGARPDRGRLGHWAALAALLLTDGRRARSVRLVEEVRPFLDSVKSSIDEIVNEVYWRMRTARGIVPLQPAEARPSGPTSIAGRRSSRGFARVAERSPGWPAEGRARELGRARGGRGRVTEKVVERGADRFSTMVFESAR